ncbi:MAG: fatty acyl-AMP ligase [Legionella sp.]|nr:fatty acyl-AMP ligase [Legionella sp.]
MQADLRTCTSLVDVVQFRSVSSPQKICCIFLTKESEEQMTYLELDQHAKAIAIQLQEQGVRPGDRILLLFSPGIPFIQAFFGCLYARAIAVPIYPPAQEKLLEKAHRIITNSKPVLAIMTDEHVIKFARPGQNGTPYLDDVPCLTIERLIGTLNDGTQAQTIHKNDTAFLQYTSGSTMHPKGVIINHQNLMDNMSKIYNTYDMNEQTIVFSWLPPHHDMGLIGCILTPIYGGVPIIMMSPFSFLQNPLSWLQNITKYKVTISGSPNFAYDYCVKRIREEKKQGLDLSSWRIASNGAEPIRKETMEQFYQAFKDYGFDKKAFFPCYGLAEATLLVTGSTPGTLYRTVELAKEQYQDHRVHFADKGAIDHYSLVSCGQLVQTVKIVDPEQLTLCAEDQIGEIWVHSDSVSQGYWNQEEETAHAFNAFIKDDTSNQGYLRTGDLGFIHKEELYVTGRIKDLIILYGKNHYPQDIEYSIQHAPVHTRLGKCAAFIIQADHEYQLVVMCEVKNRFMKSEEQESLFNEIFELVYQAHQLEIHRIVLTPLKAMPHTTSGKIRRNFCRKYLLENTIPIVATWQLNKGED